MCGIFGLILRPGAGTDSITTQKIVKDFFLLSETRGKESAGIAIRSEATKQILVLKRDIPASKFVTTADFKTYFESATNQSFLNGKAAASLAIIGHSRLVTNGSQENNDNNQPVIKSGGVMIHNGIVTNVDELWSQHKQKITRQYEVDTEVLLDLTRLNQQQGHNLVTATQSAFGEIEGAASTATFFDDFNALVLATNTGSLYIAQTQDTFFFSSEKYILSQVLERLRINPSPGSTLIEWIVPFSGVVLNLENLVCTRFDLREKSTGPNLNLARLESPFTVKNCSPSSAPVSSRPTANWSQLERFLEFNIDRIAKLKRCAKCILPDTFPYIEFDDQGVCNFCRNYKPSFQTDRRKELTEVLARYRRPKDIDTIVAFSGGRDSCYGLHLLKTELDMRPITFTYDWGMVTDLARRNIARVCGQLGIENILISADIKKKRENIRKNVAAWLCKPELGMIPLFMAGDKQFFMYTNRLKAQTGIALDVWLGNRLENTDFKTGFAKTPPDFSKERIDALSITNKFRLPLFYAQNFIKNPRYLNSSLGDTVSAYYAYYFEPRRDYYLLYDFIPWDETTIEQTLINEYNWELAEDTTSSWRIGDGTAPFYNYIYFTVAGFSEFETFRSNQIREGLIDRSKALSLVLKENQPRLQSLKWYLDTIQLDFEDSIRTINQIPKLYA